MNISLAGWAVLWVCKGWFQSSQVIFSLIASHWSKGPWLAGGKAGCKEKESCLGKKGGQCSRKRGKSFSHTGDDTRGAQEGTS